MGSALYEALPGAPNQFLLDTLHITFFPGLGPNGLGVLLFFSGRALSHGFIYLLFGLDRVLSPACTPFPRCLAPPLPIVKVI